MSDLLEEFNNLNTKLREELVAIDTEIAYLNERKKKIQTVLRGAGSLGQSDRASSIQERRTHLGISYAVLSERSGVSRSSITNLVRGVKVSEKIMHKVETALTELESE